MRHCGCLTEDGWPCVACQAAHARELSGAFWRPVLAGHDLDLYYDTRAAWDAPDTEEE